MKDIMVDIETIGTRNDSVITQIGACYFDRNNGDVGDEFIMNVEMSSCIEAGLTVTSGSLKFWFDNKRNITWLREPVRLSLALQKFGDFINKKKNCLLWSHATFDMIVLASGYRAIKQGIPWSYRNVRDIRTLVDLSGVKYKKKEGEDEKTHDALEDCHYQVIYCTKCFQALQHTD